MNDAVKYTRNDKETDHREIFDTSIGHSPFKKLFYKEMREEIVDIIKSLSERNQLIMSLYYQDNMSFREIGLILELTESRVSQIRTKAIAMMRSFYKEEEVA